MSKCRPDCCSGSSGDGSGAAIIGFIVLVVAVYGIFRVVAHAVETVAHVAIEIVEITAITAGSVAAVTLLTFIAIRIRRWRREQTQSAGLKVRAIALNPAVPPIVAASGPGKPPLGAAQLFAEVVASPNMDPRFVEKILRDAMEGPWQ